MKIAEKKSARRMCIGGLLVACGVLLPQVFHMAGGPGLGGTSLPMHIPVFVAGMLLGDFYGLAVGLLAPVLSFLLTGMPPFARLPFMVVELAVYGWVSGLASRRTLPVLVSLVTAQIAGRVAYGCALFAGVGLFGVEVSPIAAVAAALTAGLPGIALQLIVIPPLVIFIRRRVMHVETVGDERARTDGA